MPLAPNQYLLDYVGGGYPWLNTLSDTGIDPDGLDLDEGGAPYYSSLGEESTSVMRVTQVVTEILRDNTDPGGGNLRTTQVVLEVLTENNETIYVTQLVTEALYANPTAASNIGLGKSWMVFDEVNHLDVLIQFGDPPTSAASKVAVLNGANHALWGNEVLAFRDVTSLGSNVYRLSCLLRGRFGTEWAMNTHKLGDQFVLMSTSTLNRTTHVTGDIGVGRLYKAVTNGMTLQQAWTRGFANTARGLKPYAPCHVTGSRDGSDNLTITWVRRTRSNGEWRDLVDVPLGETAEEYEVDILNSAGTVVRTIEDITSQTTVYSAANQTTDFGAPQALITVVIYQLNGVVGRGYGTTIAL